MNEVVNVSEVTNGAEDVFTGQLPYKIHLVIEGSADLLLHRWNCEAIEEKGKQKKNSAAKKTDNVESYVYRLDNGELALPGEYLRQAVINSAKYMQDPRSPRKSAMDLYKAGLVSLTHMAGLGVKTWDYLDKRRVMIQRQGVNRVRPALKAPWRAAFDLQVLTPEYIDQITLREVIEQAGRLIGVGDFRPTFGRFGLVRFDVVGEKKAK